MTEIGWLFEVVRPGGSSEILGFSATGTYSYDGDRDVTKTIGGFVLVPEQARKVDLILDRIRASLLIDGQALPMGSFVFTTEIIRPDIVLDRGISADLRNVSLGDLSALLIRNTGEAETLRRGFDPGQEMGRIISSADLPHSVAGSASASLAPVTWDGNTTDLAKVKQLATLAGHRPPWMNNAGVITSVSSQVVETDVIALASLSPVEETITVSNEYLTAPNRVIVIDNTFGQYALRGQWDAPGSAPHSEGNRGYVRTEVVEIQGLGSGAHANDVAATIGEGYTARKLTATILPTHRLDGPEVISYDGALWLLRSWSCGTGAGALMSFEAEELVL